MADFGLAAVLDAFAAPPRLAAGENPGAPAADEVVVAMRLAPINPADLLTIEGRYPHAQTPPFVLGAEGVGEVVATGGAVRSVRPGDHVLPLTRGNWCGFRKLREHELTAAPAGLAPQQAAMLRINGSTAWRLLHGRGLEPGDWIVQNAAGSSVGALVRLIAARRGLQVINVVRRPDAGPQDADWMVDGPDLAARVRARAGQGRIRLALDCVAGAGTGRLAECLDPRGKLVVFGHLSGAPCEIPSPLLTAKGLLIEGFSLRPAEAAGPEPIGAVLEEVAALLRGRADALPVRAVYPLAELQAALAAARAPGHGRVLLDLGG
jgi:NADPH:quinone reductase-like Zn-dependent oxidoreductase